MGSWISGVRSAGVELGRPGERLGLPAEGPGAIAGFARRTGAIVIDWLIALAITQGIFSTSSWVTLGVFGVEYLLMLPLLGATIGMRIWHIGVVIPSGRAPGPLMTLVRTILLCLAVPALIWDRDQRGLHDKAAGTVVVRTR